MQFNLREKMYLGECCLKAAIGQNPYEQIGASGRGAETVHSAMPNSSSREAGNKKRGDSLKRKSPH